MSDSTKLTQYVKPTHTTIGDYKITDALFDESELTAAIDSL